MKIFESSFVEEMSPKSGGKLVQMSLLSDVERLEVRSPHNGT